MERDHMDVKYTALGFIDIHPAGTVNEVILYFASRRCTWARWTSYSSHIIKVKTMSKMHHMEA